MGNMTDTALAVTRPAVADLLRGWDHLEWWVGNARATTAWLCSGFGFRPLAYAGPETGVPDRVSYVLGQGEVRFVVTAGIDPASEVGRFVLEHGDGVRNLAWRVDDPSLALESAVRRGAVCAVEPHAAVDASGTVSAAGIETFGTTRQLFVDRSGYDGVWAPGFEPTRLAPPAGTPVGLESIDHVVGNVEEGRLDEWVAWFEEVLGFRQLRHFDESQIATAYSALRSTVMRAGKVTMPINEPAPGLRKSQITEYLEAYRGPGVQHVALSTTSIVTAVASMRERGVRFLDMPAAYYEDARERCAGIDVAWDDLERLGIEVDTDTGGYLLQIFTETLTDRPTAFVEVIERRGATGFGEGNFKALFEAIEREQARRGNL
jgi:4-hydroxyphenylpyruvate dioxygenase